MSSLFHIILYQPLFNALIFLYNTITFHDLGIAIILLTILVRLILYPVFYKSIKNQTLMQKLQPEIQKIQHDHKDNKEKQAQALMALYRQHKVNPFAGFFLLFIQLPILIALYRVFLNGFKPEDFSNLYNFIHAPEAINHLFLGLIDLKNRSILMVGLAAIAQYLQSRLTLPKRLEKDQENVASRISRQMIYVGPLLTTLVLYPLPAAIGLYWLTTSAFSLIQQIIINKKLNQDGTIKTNS